MTTKTAIRLIVFLVASLLAYASMAPTAHAQKRPDVYKQVAEDPNLPRVLLLGDSISIGYTLPTREALRGIANVQRPATNCGPTTKGLKQIDQWLGKKPWDVIHFNFGLHDLKHLDKNGKFAKNPKDGTAQVPIDQYEKNLDKIVQRLKETGAVLIWRTTTPVPKGSAGRIQGDAARYNEAAFRVMKKYNVQIHDLYTFCQPLLEEIQRPANVHFTAAGSELLGEEVAKEIKKHVTVGQGSP